MKIHAYAARVAKAALEPFEYEPKPLADDEVEVEITHCGICHSDVHLVDGDWGEHFPCVPGHEIVGTVAAGKARAVGTRVGIGWQRGSCGRCEYCLGGEQELCPRSEATCEDNFGGFADRIRVKAHFAVPLPTALDSAAAAPLLCGGVTVYSPLRRLAGKGMRVGVIGIGGLGHLALQFARAIGCEVTAFSTREEKEAEARSFGAHDFITGTPAKRSLDLILNTAHALPQLPAFLAALRPKGTFCQLGAAAEPLEIPSFFLIGGRHTVTGSAIGAPGVIAEMLELAAREGIAARIEPLPMAEVNAALDRTRRNQARYRMVVVN